MAQVDVLTGPLDDSQCEREPLRNELLDVEEKESLLNEKLSRDKATEEYKEYLDIWSRMTKLEAGQIGPAILSRLEGGAYRVGTNLKIKRFIAPMFHLQDRLFIYSHYIFLVFPYSTIVQPSNCGHCLHGSTMIDPFGKSYLDVSSVPYVTFGL